MYSTFDPPTARMYARNIVSFSPFGGAFSVFWNFFDLRVVCSPERGAARTALGRYIFRSFSRRQSERSDATVHIRTCNDNRPRQSLFLPVATKYREGYYDATLLPDCSVGSCLGTTVRIVRRTLTGYFGSYNTHASPVESTRVEFLPTWRNHLRRVVPSSSRHRAYGATR